MIDPVTPVQQHPVLEGQPFTFQRTWYLYLQSLLQYGGTQIIDMTLTSAAGTTISAPKGGMVDLVVIIRQDATGGRTFTWGSGFSATSNNIVTTALTVSTFRFVLAGGFYVMVGQPTTGMTP